MVNNATNFIFLVTFEDVGVALGLSKLRIHLFRLKELCCEPVGPDFFLREPLLESLGKWKKVERRSCGGDQRGGL